MRRKNSGFKRFSRRKRKLVAVTPEASVDFMGDRGQVANPGVISGKQYDTKEIKSNMKIDKHIKEKVYAFTSIKSNALLL